MATEVVTIKPPRLRTVAFNIIGTSPYCQNRFSNKAAEAMKAAQMSGSQKQKGVKREAKDFDACYEGALHSTGEWYGIPASALRSAMISACRLVGFQMTKSKISVFVEADGYDRVDSQGLVRITHGAPRPIDSPMRNDNGSFDIRRRPVWDPGWKAVVRVTFDEDMFSASDVANLLMRAGLQVGVGEGRHDSRDSTGCGWGCFTIEGGA